MSAPARGRTRVNTKVVGDNPLEGEQLLLEALYGPRKSQRSVLDQRDTKAPKPEHYKVVSISLYIEDIERLEGIVAELKKRGHTKSNKSQVIRQALAQLDIDAVPRQT
jgi:hypothetical protein